MKKLFKVLGIAVAIGTVLGFGFVGCSDDSYDEAVVQDNLNPSTDAVWDFSKLPARGMSDSEGSVSGTVNATKLKGASLTIDGSGKWVQADGRIQAGANTVTLATATKSKMKFDLHLAAKSVVTIVAAAAGGNDAKRIVAVTKKDSETVIAELSANMPTLPNTTDKTAAKTLVGELAAGDYTIWLNGANLFSISAKSEDFKSSKKELTTTLTGTLSAVSSNTAVATVAVKDGKVTVTSKKLGETKIIVTTDAGKDNDEYAITVNGDGSIEIAEPIRKTFQEATKTDGELKAKLNANFGTIKRISIVKGSSITVESDGSAWSIKSVEIGETEITVYDDSSNEQNIIVTVATDGAITLEAGTSPFISSTIEDLDKSVFTIEPTSVKVSSKKGSIVSAKLDNNKLTLTSMEPGTATVTASNASGHNAVLEVTVKADGSMTYTLKPPLSANSWIVKYAGYAADKEFKVAEGAEPVVIFENDLFKVESAATMVYKAITNGTRIKEGKATLVDDETVVSTIDYDSGLRFSSAVAKKTGDDPVKSSKVKISAKKALSNLNVYMAIANDSYNSDRKSSSVEVECSDDATGGTLTCNSSTENITEKKATVTQAARSNLTELALSTLAADDTVEINVSNADTGNTCNLWLFGIEAKE